MLLVLLALIFLLLGYPSLALVLLVVGVVLAVAGAPYGRWPTRW